MRAPTATLVVEDGLSGVRLADYLERAWPGADRKALRRLVRDGQATVNGVAATPGQKLRAGDVVLVDADGTPDVSRRRVSETAFGVADLPVLAETDFALVVDKPAGLPCVPDRAGRTQGVHGLLAALRPDDDLRIAHRLDRFTSGCLVLAKGLHGARWIDEQLRARTVRKEYHALVEGVMNDDRVTVTRWLGPDPRRPGKVIVVKPDAKGAREAITGLEVVERFKAHTLVRCLPLTGRGHQIRVHLRAVGHPIAGDVDYGASGPVLLSSLKRGFKARKGLTEKPLLAHFFLHAASVEMPAPDGGAPLRAEAPLPKALATVLAKLRHFSG
ncbi:MAG: RluA family pseudouridine synthase [Planctomycetes bacterium]|nr:RluA family pseudouridine synthase [Planctomycetota bacterium]